MNQEQFEAFMADQLAAIEASGVDAEAWIESHSTAFRAAYEGAMRVEESSPASILTLHPHPLVRAGIVASLHRHGGFEVGRSVAGRVADIPQSNLSGKSYADVL